MPLSYDFDIFNLIPTELSDDPMIGNMLGSIGFNTDAMGNKKAMFRSQETIDALKASPESMQAFFEDAGFGMVVYDSGAPAGQFPAQDDTVRLAIIQNLTEMSKDVDRTGWDEAPFSTSDFFTAALSAEPMTEQETEPRVATTERPVVENLIPAAPVDEVEPVEEEVVASVPVDEKQSGPSKFPDMPDPNNLRMMYVGEQKKVKKRNPKDDEVRDSLAMAIAKRIDAFRDKFFEPVKVVHEKNADREGGRLSLLNR